MKFKKPDTALIEDMLADDGVVAPYGEWMRTAIINLGVIIQKSPRNYRNYGPYWYRIKSMLVAYGFEYETENDGDIIPASTPDHVVLAAGIMLSASNAAGAVFSNSHQLDDGEGGTSLYVLEDAEMEAAMLEHSAKAL